MIVKLIEQLAGFPLKQDVSLHFSNRRCSTTTGTVDRILVGRYIYPTQDIHPQRGHHSIVFLTPYTPFLFSSPPKPSHRRPYPSYPFLESLILSPSPRFLPAQPLPDKIKRPYSPFTSPPSFTTIHHKSHL